MTPSEAFAEFGKHTSDLLTIHWPRRPGETQDDRMARFDSWKCCLGELGTITEPVARAEAERYIEWLADPHIPAG